MRNKEDFSKNVHLAVLNAQFLKLASLPVSLACATVDQISEQVLLLNTVKITYDTCKNCMTDVNSLLSLNKTSGALTYYVQDILSLTINNI